MPLLVEPLPDRVLVYADDGDAVVAAVHDRGLAPQTVLVRRSSLYMASLVAFILGMVLLGSSQYEAVAQQGQRKMLGYTTVPVKLQLGNQHNWNID